jgi:hypothetical protein
LAASENPFCNAICSCRELLFENDCSGDNAGLGRH